MTFRSSALPWLLACGVALCATAGQTQTVGNVGAVNQDASSQPPGGSKRKLTLGAGVVQREMVQTDANGSAQIAFTDRSALNIGRNSTVVIDKFVFDPASGAGEMTTTLTRGVLRFVGGKVSHDTGATIRTPSATIGVRGGVVTMGNDQSGALHIILHFGSAMVQTPGGVVGLNRSGFETVIPPGGAPTPPQRVDPATLAAFMASLTSGNGQTGGARHLPNNTDAARFGVGSPRLSGQPLNYDLPGVRDDLVRGQTLTRSPLGREETSSYPGSYRP